MHELNKIAEKDTESDVVVDKFIKNTIGKKDNVVIDARTAFFLIPNSVKIFLDSDFDIRCRRIMASKRRELQEH